MCTNLSVRMHAQRQIGGEITMAEVDTGLHAEILQAVSKEGRPYECVEVRLGDVSVGRIFPRPLEMAAIKQALGY